MTEIDLDNYIPQCPREKDILEFGAHFQTQGSYINEFGRITYPCMKDEEGCVLWYNMDGEYHREDGPAIIYTDDCEYYLNGKEFYDINEWLSALNKTDEEKMLLKLQYS